ncbi:putative MFS-type transporter C09D4.1 [Trichonephila clavipes]|nr:putative MFS-type transporter C09D4.1 [Trichonephila clavipes]
MVANSERTTHAKSVGFQLASATQFATLNPDSFPFVMVVSFFAAVSNLFVLGVPPALAAKWFPSQELSRACSFGVFGNQLGVALGFIFSPLIVPADCLQKDLISIGKRNIAYILTAVNIVVFILIIFSEFFIIMHLKEIN